MLAGGTAKPQELDNPVPEWISERSWNDILTTAVLDLFSTFAGDFKNNIKGFKMIFDSPDPHKYDIIWSFKIFKNKTPFHNIENVVIHSYCVLNVYWHNLIKIDAMLLMGQ